MDRGAWQATVHGVAKSQTWLRDQADSGGSLRKLQQLIRVGTLYDSHFGPKINSYQ